MKGQDLNLKYGNNPYQHPARIYRKDGALPIQVLNGQPGYINLLDAFNSWQLVSELRAACNLPAAASFKHVSPAGAAVAGPLSPALKKAYFVEELELSPLATAYARARGADRVSSFGDWIAVSDPVDLSTAALIAKEVSDGMIAPDYMPEALALLRQKKKGAFNVIKMDPGYRPEPLETKEVFGICFEQRRNDIIPNRDLLQKRVTRNQDLPESALRDLVIAMITLKYTQSNSVCLVSDGQVIGCGAGQQSRIHCTRLASEKGDLWFLRQHPAVLDFQFKPGVSRTVKDIAIDQFLRDDTTAREMAGWPEIFVNVPARLTPNQKQDWLKNMTGVALGSDAFFPQRDNIDRAARSGVRYLAQPGGSVRDDLVIEACDEYGMVMAFTGWRLFHH